MVEDQVDLPVHVPVTSYDDSDSISKFGLDLFDSVFALRWFCFFVWMERFCNISQAIRTVHVVHSNCIVG